MNSLEYIKEQNRSALERELAKSGKPLLLDELFEAEDLCAAPLLNCIPSGWRVATLEEVGLSDSDAPASGAVYVDEDAPSDVFPAIQRAAKNLRERGFRYIGAAFTSWDEDARIAELSVLVKDVQ